jgi:hypothetical protein
MLHGKRHFRGFGYDLEIFEKLGEVRIGDFVVNHEAGIEGEILAVFLNRYRVGMATDAAVFFEEGDVEMSVQEMRAGKTGDACSDDGNFALQNGY